MNKDQVKPKKKWYKIRPIIILIVVIGLFLVWLVIMNQETPNTTRYDAYNSNKDQVQKAVNNYSKSHNGSFPTLNGTYTNANCSNCGVVNMSALLSTNGGLLHDVPDGTHLGNISGADNCNAVDGIGCKDFFSYIWIINKNGEIYSYCIEPDCRTNNSGYQDIWP